MSDVVVRPDASGKYPVEPKVKYTAIAMYLLGFLGLALTSAFTAADNQLLIEVLPDVAEVWVLPLVPTLVSFVVGFASSHQRREGEPAARPATDRF